MVISQFAWEENITLTKWLIHAPLHMAPRIHRYFGKPSYLYRIPNPIGICPGYIPDTYQESIGRLTIKNKQLKSWYLHGLLPHHRRAIVLQAGQWHNGARGRAGPGGDVQLDPGGPVRLGHGGGAGSRWRHCRQCRAKGVLGEVERRRRVVRRLPGLRRTLRARGQSAGRSHMFLPRCQAIGLCPSVSGTPIFDSRSDWLFKLIKICFGRAKLRDHLRWFSMCPASLTSLFTSHERLLWL